MRGSRSSSGSRAQSSKNSVKALKNGQDEVEFLRPYAPDISAWITHFSQVPAYYDANGHYARVLPIFNAFRYDRATNQLIALGPGERVSAAQPAAARGSARARPRSRPATARTRRPTTASSARGLQPEREAGRGPMSSGSLIALAVVGVIVALVVGVGAGERTTAATTRSARSSTTPRSRSRART